MRQPLFYVLKQYPVIEDTATYSTGPLDMEEQAYGNQEVACVAARAAVRHEIVEMACVVRLEPGVGMSIVHTERKK